MKVKIIGTLLTMSMVISCETKKTANVNELNGVVPLVEVDSLKRNSDTIGNIKAMPESDYDCIRGKAESVIKRTVYSNAIFELNKDNYTGTETIDLANGDRLIIRNWGCEYYVLSFCFETTRFRADTTDIKYWISKAVILMSEIEKGLDAPLDIEGGTLAIKTFLNKNKSYHLKEEIVYSDDIIRDFVTIDRIQKITNKKYGIEISYSKGPL